jgi:hypothetical protein
MPSAPRFSFLPVIVTSSAAAGGLLGAFVAVGLLTNPAPNPGGKIAASPAQETKAAPAAETTGSAAPGDNVAAAECDRQTWPYLSRECREEVQRKNRSVRVISPDRVDPATVNAIEASSAKPEEPLPQSAAGPKQGIAATPAAPAATAPATLPLPVATAEPWFNPAAPAAPLMPATTNQVASPPAATAAQDEPKPQPKQVAKKAKTKSKPKPESDDDGQSAVASSDSNDAASQDRVARPQKQRRRIVERWIERDEEPSDDRGARRVVETRRGGLFENLFGLNRARASAEDDD